MTFFYLSFIVAFHALHKCTNSHALCDSLNCYGNNIIYAKQKEAKTSSSINFQYKAIIVIPMTSIYAVCVLNLLSFLEESNGKWPRSLVDKDQWIWHLRGSEHIHRLVSNMLVEYLNSWSKKKPSYVDKSAETLGEKINKN